MWSLCLSVRDLLSATVYRIFMKCGTEVMYKNAAQISAVAEFTGNSDHNFQIRRPIWKKFGKGGFQIVSLATIDTGKSPVSR